MVGVHVTLRAELTLGQHRRSPMVINPRWFWVIKRRMWSGVLRAGRAAGAEGLEAAGTVTLAVFLFPQPVNDCEALRLSVASVRAKGILAS